MKPRGLSAFLHRTRRGLVVQVITLLALFVILFLALPAKAQEGRRFRNGLFWGSFGSMWGDYAASKTAACEGNPLFRRADCKLSDTRFFAVNLPALFGSELLKGKWPKAMEKIQIGFIAGHGAGIALRFK